MADVSDVEKSLVTQAAATLGLPAPYLPGSVVASSVVGASCKVYRGWPVKNDLDADLVAGVVNVSVFPLPNMVRLTTRYFPVWEELPSTDPTLTVAVSGRVVTFAGSTDPSQVAGILIGELSAATAYPYRVQTGDTPGSVAAALGTAISGATVSGASVTIPGTAPIIARVLADKTEWMETRRQTAGIWIITWSPTPVLRDLVASTIDAGIANMMDQYGRLTFFLPLTDGSSACIKYSSSHTDDVMQQANLWRRDLRLLCEYPTSLVEQNPVVMFPELSVGPDAQHVITTIS